MSHASLLVALDPTDDVEAAVAEQMAPFEEGDHGWFADGSRWDWYVIGGRCDGLLVAGNVIQRKALDLAALQVRNRERLTRQWEHAQTERPEHRAFIWDVQPDETLDAFVAKHGTFPAHYAFLRNRNWHEHERMGWWGATAATECERAGADTHICTHEKDGVRIISWGGSASWHKMFFPRFVEPLSSETMLVTVDYHV